MLHTHHLHYRYPSGEALRFPDIACGRDEHWLLLGPSGSGKTTLLHLLAGLLTPTGGEVRIGDTSLSSLRGARLDYFRGQHVGVIFQQSHFVAALSVLENLLLAQKLAHRPLDRTRARELLERLGIGRKERAKPSELSQGEQQRVAIARALINAPQVILADEPTSALDDGHAEEVAALLEEQARSVNATLLIVTHDQRLKERFPRQIRLEPSA